MERGELARRADEAKMRLEVARSKLEHSAQRWAERRGPRTLRDLHSAAEEFDAAERAVTAAARAWARAVRTAGPSLAALPLQLDGEHAG
jgi:hypothetical protein